MNEPTFKPISHKAENWQEIKDLATELTQERGSTVSLAAAVAEAVKFFKENRPKS
jgi:hypothetical protein